MKIRIYTDGACSGNPGPGGWGMVFNSDEKCDTFSGMSLATTNNQMELMAVIKALARIIKNYDVEDEFELYSDSAYVISSINQQWVARWKLNNWRTTSGDKVKNQDLWLKFDRVYSKLIADGYKVKFIKVKGHSGNTFNELVDSIARNEALNAKKFLEEEMMAT